MMNNAAKKAAMIAAEMYQSGKRGDTPERAQEIVMHHVKFVNALPNSVVRRELVTAFSKISGA